MSDFGSVISGAHDIGFRRQHNQKPSAPPFQEFVDTSALEALHRCRPRGFVYEPPMPRDRDLRVGGDDAAPSIPVNGEDTELLRHAMDLAPRVRAGLELLGEVSAEWKRQSSADGSRDAEGHARFARVQLEGLHSIRREYMDDFMRYLQSLDALLGRLHATTRQKGESPDVGGE